MLSSKMTYSHNCIHFPYGLSQELNPLFWHGKCHALPTELHKWNIVFFFQWTQWTQVRSVNTGWSLPLSGCVTETGLSALRPGNRKRSTCGSDSITLTVSVGETEDVTSTQWSKNSTRAIWNRQLFLSLSEGGEWFKLISVKRYEKSKLRGSGVELKPKWSKWYKCHLSLGWTLAWTLSPTSFSLGKKRFDWKMTDPH